MFGMGMTLKPQDFVVVARHPEALVVGVVAQFVIMPLVAFVLCTVGNIPSEIAIGVILVGTCPGGTASNVITYLAGGNVALSVAMTTISTLLSPALTPLLTYLYAGTWISVPVTGMFFSIMQVIIIPIALGLGVRILFKEKIERVEKLLPSVSVVAIVIIIASITSANANTLATVGFFVLAVVMLHNGIGLALGYIVSALLGFGSTIRRTIAIEVGMQNSGLAVSLAVMHFGSLAALPGALFSIWHNISGSVVAWWWGKRYSK